MVFSDNIVFWLWIFILISFLCYIRVDLAFHIHDQFSAVESSFLCNNSCRFIFLLAWLCNCLQIYWQPFRNYSVSYGEKKETFSFGFFVLAVCRCLLFMLFCRFNESFFFFFQKNKFVLQFSSSLIHSVSTHTTHSQNCDIMISCIQI